MRYHGYCVRALRVTVRAWRLVSTTPGGCPPRVGAWLRLRVLEWAGALWRIGGQVGGQTLCPQQEGALRLERRWGGSFVQG